jgi:hypothetical protein
MPLLWARPLVENGCWMQTFRDTIIEARETDIWKLGRTLRQINEHVFPVSRASSTVQGDLDRGGIDPHLRVCRQLVQ